MYRKILKKAGLKPRFRGMGIEIINRRDREGKLFRVVLNHTAKKKRAFWKRIGPYGMKIIR